MLLLTTNARQIDPYPRAPSILLRLWLFLSCFRVSVLLLGGDLLSTLLRQLQPVFPDSPSLLAEIGREAWLTDEDCAVFDQVRDKTPSEPVSFE